MANTSNPGPSRRESPAFSRPGFAQGQTGVRLLILVILAVLALTGLAWSVPRPSQPSTHAMAAQNLQGITPTPAPTNTTRVFFGLFTPGDSEDTTWIIIGSGLLVFIILSGTLAALRPQRNKP
jgi:hypothetical protein